MFKRIYIMHNTLTQLVHCYRQTLETHTHTHAHTCMHTHAHTYTSSTAMETTQPTSLISYLIKTFYENRQFSQYNKFK